MAGTVWKHWFVVGALGLFGLSLAGSLPAAGQDVGLGLRMYKIKAECWRCHGWAGDGHGDINTPAPALRPSQLDRTALIEVIQCGRPGTTMPFHKREGYTNDPATSCYGLTEADAGNQLPTRGKSFLSQNETEALAEYLIQKVIGRGEVTKEECEEYWGAGNANCA